MLLTANCSSVLLAEGLKQKKEKKKTFFGGKLLIYIFMI
jgi:hypothetical protein